MAINEPTTRLRVDHVIRHFRSTANSNDHRGKNIRIREKIVYTAKLSGFKSFRIQSSHFKFRTSLIGLSVSNKAFIIIIIIIKISGNLRRHDQTGEFLFRIRPLLCKRKNQSGTKTLRIHHESGTIPSSVNLQSWP